MKGASPEKEAIPPDRKRTANVEIQSHATAEGPFESSAGTESSEGPGIAPRVQRVRALREHGPDVGQGARPEKERS